MPFSVSLLLLLLASLVSLFDDLNVEPDRIPCLLKGRMAGHWFDLQSSWASASGVDSPPTCCKTFGSGCGSLRDFILGCSHAISALRWCSVLQERWILPHYAVRASFSVGRWSAEVCLPVRSSVLWPAAWVSCVDKSRGSKSVEVRRIWEVYDESLSFIPPAFWRGIRSSLLAGDVSYAWRVWSFFAEVSLVRAFRCFWRSCFRVWFSTWSWCCQVSVCLYWWSCGP